MFKEELKRKFEQIFGLRKTTFDDPSDKFEQDTLFITVAQSRNNTGQGKETAMVRGFLTVYTQNNKLPFGFFNKRINMAEPELTKGLFFYDMDVDVLTSPARMQNICERRVSFEFLYSAPYDPKKKMASVEFCNEGES